MKKIYENRSDFYIITSWLIITIIILVLPSAILFSWLWRIGINMGEASSIGIIGGADGPTSVFVSAGKVSLSSGLPSIIIPVGVLVGWIYTFVKYRRDRDKLVVYKKLKSIVTYCI